MRFIIGILLLGLFFFSVLYSVSGEEITYQSTDDSLTLYEHSGVFTDDVPPANVLPPAGTLSEASSGDYDDILAEDSSRWTIAVSNGRNGYLIANLSLNMSNPASSVTSINWTWVVDSYDADVDVSFYMWNSTASEWFECTTNLTTGTGSQTKACSVSSGVSDFVEDSQYTYFMAYFDNTALSLKNVLNDYIRADVTYSTTESILQSPVNGIITNNPEVIFTCNATDASSLNNITLYGDFNGSTFQSNESASVSGTSNSSDFNITLAEGTFTWNCIADGSTSITFAADNYTLTVDTTAPLLSILSPTNDSNHTQAPEINLSIDSSDYSSCWWTSDAGTTNTSFTCGANITGQSWSEGLNTVVIFVNDTASNENSTHVSFNHDSVSPSITISVPSDSQEFNTNISLSLNFSASDATQGVDSCWYSLNQESNISLPNCANTTLNVSEDTHTVYVYANDSFGNIGQASSTFTVSISAPAINLDYPANGTVFTTKNDLFLNYTATDTDGIDSCQVWHDAPGMFSLNTTNTGITSGAQNFTTLNVSQDGLFSWNVYCNDTSGNARFATVNHSFYVDTLEPDITSTDVVTSQGSQTVGFTTTFTEANCNATFYSVFNSTDGIDGSLENVSSSCTSFSDTFAVLAFASYTLRTYVRDVAGNENFTDKAFTTTQLPPADSGGGGGLPIIVSGNLIPAVNFSIHSIGFGNTLDVVLAKDSVKPRTRPFIMVNKDIEPVTVRLECDPLQNVTTDSGFEINICDYVNFSQSTFTLTPNELVNTQGMLSIIVPPDAKFGDRYNFNILAIEETDGEDVHFDKLSVTARVPVWALVYKWSFVFTTNPDLSDDDRIKYPVAAIALLVPLIVAPVMYFASQKRLMAIVGFVLSVGTFIGLFLIITIFL